jgi:hypothetical protein
MKEQIKRAARLLYTGGRLLRPDGSSSPEAGAAERNRPGTGGTHGSSGGLGSVLIRNSSSAGGSRSSSVPLETGNDSGGELKGGKSKRGPRIRAESGLRVGAAVAGGFGEQNSTSGSNLGANAALMTLPHLNDGKSSKPQFPTMGTNRDFVLAAITANTELMANYSAQQKKVRLCVNDFIEYVY